MVLVIVFVTMNKVVKSLNEILTYGDSNERYWVTFYSVLQVLLLFFPFCFLFYSDSYCGILSMFFAQRNLNSCICLYYFFLISHKSYSQF